jgi:proteasome lid subunit RPN8/RPN11
MRNSDETEEEDHAEMRRTERLAENKGMENGLQIRMSERLAAAIRKHGAETYPHECCGALLGREAAGNESQGREILAVLAFANQREDSPQNRFSVAPRDVIDADKTAQAEGLEVLGWYHSHPDHPAKPSEYDREHAWPWYSYVILKVEKGEAREMTSWRLREDRKQYDEERIEMEERSKDVRK